LLAVQKETPLADLLEEAILDLLKKNGMDGKSRAKSRHDYSL